MIVSSTLSFTISCILKGAIRHPYMGQIYPVTAAHWMTSSSSKCFLSSDTKSVNDLQSQWAGGRDIWPSVPDGDKRIRLTTRVKTPTDKGDISLLQWPSVVQTSILYGFGAYNPRGVLATEEYNVQHHEMLKADIIDGIARLFPIGVTVWWEAASQWEDGSSERGFIVAFNRAALLDKEAGKKWSIDLATKFQQGAIYEFQYECDATVPSKGKMRRRTVAVLDSGTDADVEIVIDTLDGDDTYASGEEE